MCGEILKEVLSEDPGKCRLAGANRIVQFAKRAPEKWRMQEENTLALRVRMVGAKNLCRRRVTKATIRVKREHFDAGKSTQ